MRNTIIGISVIIISTLAMILLFGSVTNWIVANNHGGSYHPTLIEVIINDINFLKSLKIW